MQTNEKSFLKWIVLPFSILIFIILFFIFGCTRHTENYQQNVQYQFVGKVINIEKRDGKVILKVEWLGRKGIFFYALQKDTSIFLPVGENVEVKSESDGNMYTLVANKKE